MAKRESKCGTLQGSPAAKLSMAQPAGRAGVPASAAPAAEAPPYDSLCPGVREGALPHLRQARIGDFHCNMSVSL